MTDYVYVVQYEDYDVHEILSPVFKDLESAKRLAEKEYKMFNERSRTTPAEFELGWRPNPHSNTTNLNVSYNKDNCWYSTVYYIDKVEVA